MKLPRSFSWLLPGLPILIFAMQAVRSASFEALWSDEIFSYFMVGNPAVGLRAVWQAVWDGRDGMMPLFYLVHYFWGMTLHPLIVEALGDAMPRAAEFVWRLPSLVATIGGMAVLGWWLTRRIGATYSALVLAIALFGSQVILAHVSGFRGYGMLLGLSACFLVAMDAWVQCGRRLAWIVAALVTTAMAMTHLMGLIFALAGVAGVALKCNSGKSRHGAALLIASPAVVLTLLCLPMLLHVAALADPWSWIPTPRLLDLPQGFLVAQLDHWLIPALMTGAVVALIAPERNNNLRSGEPNVLPILSPALAAVAIAWLILPSVLWLISQFTTPLFLDRYFLPVALAGGLVGTATLDRAGGWRAVSVAVSILSLGNFFDLAMIRQTSGANENVAGEQLYPPEHPPTLPVSYLHLTDHLHSFLEAIFYGEEPASQWHYLFDLPSAQDISSGEPRRLSNEIQLLLAHARTWKETGGLNGVPADRLLPLADFRKVIEVGSARQLRIVMDRTLDQRAANMASAMLEDAGWKRVGREIISPPRGSPTPAIERTLWLPPAHGDISASPSVMSP